MAQHARATDIRYVARFTPNGNSFLSGKHRNRRLVSPQVAQAAAGDLDPTIGGLAIQADGKLVVRRQYYPMAGQGNSCVTFETRPC
jgi:hypothetical protein